MIGLAAWNASPCSVSAHEDGESVIDVEPAHVAAGQSVRVAGEAFTDGDTVSLVLRTATGDEILSTGTVDTDGHFSVSLTVPKDLPSRAYELQAVSSDGDTLSAVITVTRATADHGTNFAPFAAVGSGMLVLGAGGAFVVRRRQRSGTV